MLNNESGLNPTQQRLISKIKLEMGREVVDALSDDNVIEIMLNPDGSMWIEKLGTPMYKLSRHTCSAQAAIHTVASYLNTTVTVENPILECELPICGSRFEALVPPIVSQASFTIRKKAKSVFTLSNYVDKEIITQAQKELLEEMTKTHKNILIAGGTGSGKTTLTNAIIEAIVNFTPEDRIIIIEDTAEIQCTAMNFKILRSNTNTTMNTLLKATMRLRPDRILVGEVRGGEALTLLKSWNTGHPGGVATVHANSANGALTRIEQLVAEATNADSRAIIAEAIDVIVFIAKTATGRKVQEVIEVKGYDFMSQKYIVKKII